MANEPKELFNQGLADKLNDSERIATGSPGSEGANNHTKSSFFGSVFKKGTENVSSGSQKITFSGEAYDDANYIVMVQSNVGYEITLKETDGFTINMLAATEINYLAVRF